jgi:23S rRNA G2445 N2-methylase RlmL
VKRDLRAAVEDPGFTPAVKHVRELVALAEDESLGEAVERALARLGAALGPALQPLVTNAGPRARVHALRALGRAGDGGEAAVAVLSTGLEDELERVRRASATALGKLARGLEAPERSEIEAALLAAWSRATTDSERRVLSEALGKTGGERSRARLASPETDDAVLGRAIAKARLMLDRTERRGEPGGIRAGETPARPLPIVLWMRRGLERIVIDQLGRGWNATVDRAGRVRATLTGPLEGAWKARAAERFAIALPDVKMGLDDDLATAIADALVAAEASIAPLTEGPIRFRLSWAAGGHRRALVWKIAELVSERSTAFVNDPTESLWELAVEERVSGATVTLGLTLAPRGLDDPRFAYRTADVPAASHPTLAAALAHVAGVSADDVVWDPFVGSGLELVERAKLGRVAALFGSDVEDAALEAARTNLANAGVTATLQRADALTHFPAGTSVVLTNPPMGRRVHRKGDIGEFLAAFVAHVASRLPPRGRLVWLSPQPERTREAGERAGLAVEGVVRVDMGGFDAELQIMVRPLPPARDRRERGSGASRARRG